MFKVTHLPNIRTVQAAHLPNISIIETDHPNVKVNPTTQGPKLARFPNLLTFPGLCLAVSRVAAVRFGYGLRVARFQRFRFSVPAVALG